MKRRQRKPILDINGEQTDPSRRRWQNKYEQIADDHSEQNGSSKNPLFNLVGHYDSDSESDDKQLSSNILHDKVDDFMKEIQAMNPEKSSLNNQMTSLNKNHNFDSQYNQTNKSAWQECFDESTGYPYYWHMETNEVTWELPEELQMKKNVSHGEMSHNQFMQWSASSAKTYAQIQNNIPDGMIPKEVVARNRNRQAGAQQNVVAFTTERQLDNNKKHQYSKDEDSDDGKIEMITSFGNDDTDSSSSEESVNKSPEKVTKRKDKSKPKRVQNSPSRKEPVQMGPSLPKDMDILMVHGPENIHKNVKPVPLEETAKPANEGPAIPLSKILENATESYSNTKNVQENSTSKREREAKLKVSLVPGYEDDSDNEEENFSKQSKPLFPIVDSESKQKVSKSEIICNEKLVKKVETRQTESGCVRIFEYHSSEGEKEGPERTNDEGDEKGSKTEMEEGKSEQQEIEKKANKFLDEIDAPSKAFQRKKRIAFDVIPTKPRPESQEHSDPVATSFSSTNYENDEKYGLGFQDKNSEELSKSAKEGSSVLKSGINFVKGETINTTPKEESAKTSALSESKKEEVKTLIDITIEKLKFLSEGSPPASAVQIMAIQLQTLLNAWESKDLKETYLCNWLTETSRELTRLEQTAAPPGWECQWDRSHKRYFYRNVSSGEMQWTYPETDVVGGTEEMELCTTPPPEQEEASVIVENASNMEQSVANFQEENKTSSEVQSKPISAPPPPQISSPSPPPPPRINADDLKRGQKRKDEEKVFDNNKKEKLDKDVANTSTNAKSSEKQTVETNSSKGTTITGNEPLPPGVDSPDLNYSLATSAMDSTVLYTAASQQSNPIYAATLGSTAVPLLAHHTALMQGQLMHYSGYHPLHNQMIMATANRLADQDTIQFMVADYSRVYESSQVIAKPPVKTTQRESICSAIDSFYNDIASIEQNSKMESEKNSMETVPSTTVQVQQSEAEKSPASIDTKEKKKKKTKLGIGKKQKEVSSMVAKWQKVQKNLSD